jgi:hypothetical protein
VCRGTLVGPLMGCVPSMDTGIFSVNPNGESLSVSSPTVVHVCAAVFRLSLRLRHPSLTASESVA